MNSLPKRAMRSSAAALVLGALAVASAGATDWQALDSWGGSSGAGANASATGGATETGKGGAEIADAFKALGMSAARAECYGEVLASKLSGDKQREAADLVRTASDAEEVRQNVITAGPTLVGSFSAANEQCPEGMGG